MTAKPRQSADGPAAAYRGDERTLGSFIVDGRGTILAFDEDLESLTGLPAADVVGRPFDHAAIEEDEAAQTTARHPLYEGSIAVPAEIGASASADLRLRCADGRTLDVEAVSTRLSGDGERIGVSIATILARSELPAARGGFDLRDPLTGLAEERVFRARLAHMFGASATRGRPVALILADVDHLRHVNDRFGRSAGDETLRRIAGVLRAAAREEDLVARLSDDDFALVLAGAGRGEARQVAAQIRSTVERYRLFEAAGSGEPVRVTLSLGSAGYPADADNETELIERATEALEEARAHGRNRVWCYTRRPRVLVTTPVYFDAHEPLLVGFSHDLSPSGIFVQTQDPLEPGMRCALAFPLPGSEQKVHVIGRVVRSVSPPPAGATPVFPSTGMGIEFVHFGPQDRRAIEAFLHTNDAMIPGSETDLLSA